MKNINNFTKAELISKIQGLNSKETNSTISKFIDFLLFFKSFLLKITLIAIIIKIFKKFSIFRRIWSFFNLILFSIFGISLRDIYEIEILSNFLHNIFDFFNKFHNNLLDLLGKRTEVPIEFPTKAKSMGTIDQSSNGNKESSKIIERFNKIIHNEQQIKEEVEVIQEDNPIYKNKYAIIAGILILFGLSWYFYDDLKPIGTSILTWINTFRPRPDSDPNGSNGNLQGGSKTNLQSLKDKIYKTIYGEDKGKTIDFNNLSQSEIQRRGLLPQDTGLRNITGNSFTLESNAVLSEIDTFIKYTENSSFPKTDIQAGFYNLIRERLLTLSNLNENQYNDLIQNESIYNKIEKFLNLENEIMENFTESPESNSYEEIALTTIQEQDVWSDRNNHPSPRSNLLSPIDVVRELQHREEHENRILDVIENKYKDIFEEDLSFKTNTIEFHNNQELNANIEEPKLNLMIDDKDFQKFAFNKSSNSDSSMDHYFPKTDLPTIEVNKPSSSSILEQIENETIIKASPNISNVGLQPALQPSPLIHKASLSNMFEDTMNLFDDNIDLEEDNYKKNEFTQGSSKDNNQQEEAKPRLGFLDQIKSLRKEYGTPVQDNKDLESESESESSNDSKEDDNLNKINWKEEIKFDIKRGAIKDRFINIDFGNNFDKVNKILFITNDGYSQYLDAHTNNNQIQDIKWDNKGISNPDSNDLDIYKIYIIEKMGKSHEIYGNLNVKILKSFHDNVGKRV